MEEQGTAEIFLKASRKAGRRKIRVFYAPPGWVARRNVHRSEHRASGVVGEKRNDWRAFVKRNRVWPFVISIYMFLPL